VNTLVERYAQMRDMTRVHERAFHPSWSCKRAGLPETSANILSASAEIRSTLSNSALGTAKPDRIFVKLQFE